MPSSAPTRLRSPTVHADYEPSVTSSPRTEGAAGPYLRAIRSHPLLVALITLAAFAGAAAWLALRSPDYESEAQVLVTPLPQDDRSFLGLPVVRESSEPTRVMQTAATLIDSPGAADLAARRLGRGWTRERVVESVEVEPQGESNIIAITARAEDPELAARVANTFADAGLDVRGRALRRLADSEIAELEAQRGGAQPGRLGRLRAVRSSGDPTLLLSQPAVAAAAPVGASPPLILLLALVAGFTLASGAALLIELLDRRIRDEDELGALWPVPVLAHVPKLPRRLRRAEEYSPFAMPPAVREAFRTAQVQLDQRPRDSRVIMVTSASKGDGKTTSAANLAVALVGAGHRVILVDFDIRKPDVARLLRVKSDRGLISLLASNTSLADLLVQSPDLPPLRVAPVGTEGDVVLLEALSRRVPDMLAQARALADYIVIDTAPLGEVSDALRIVDYVDDIVVVTRPGHTDRASLELTRDLLARTDHHALGLLVIGESHGAPSAYYTYGVPQARDGRSRRSAVGAALR